VATKSYWIILFQVNPVPAFAPGPIKAKVNRASYENAVEAGKSGTVATLIHEKQEYKITGNQRCFQMNDGFEIFLIADAQKVVK
jgi:hypothetical protein